jgi:ribose 5-phosphate isomerase B
MKKRDFIKKAGLFTSTVVAFPLVSLSKELEVNRLPFNQEIVNGKNNLDPKNIVIGGDHAGYPLKGPLKETLVSWGYKVKDVGSFTPEPVDFPDIALLLVEEIIKGNAERGIMVCGTGVGASIACNKIKGVRAALCHDSYSAHQCVEHDNVNILCIGAQIVGIKLAEELLQNFLNAKFSTEEHFRRRVKKLDEFDLKK